MKLAATLEVVAVAVMQWAHCFNLDVSSTKPLIGPPRSHFGHSVALWHDSKPGFKRMVVGAPKSTDSSAAQDKYPLGAIHMCDFHDDSCPALENLPDLLRKALLALDNNPKAARQGIGFGETLFARSSADSNLLACAPRYVVDENYWTSTGQKKKKMSMPGACFVLSYTKKHWNIIPFQSATYRDVEVVGIGNMQGALAGFSATSVTSPSGDIVYMGGPGAFYTQGMLFSISDYRGTSNVKMNKVWPGDESLDESKEGWALTTAKFDGKTELLAASHPAFNDLLGKIVFYNTVLQKQELVLFGEEFGAWFGFCLATGDVDGDGGMDLVVGAPWAAGQSKDQHEFGKVFLYSVFTEGEVQRKQVLSGMVAWARFGTSIACADLNQDGVQDLVVGAPYGDEGGTVYVYNGRKNEGIMLEPTQVVKASDLTGLSRPLRSFGFSMDSGVEMDDNNNYPDLIVGAPHADMAVLLRAAPVVSINVRLNFEPEMIDLEDRNCPFGAINVTCFNLLLNLTYNSPGTTDNQTVIVTLDLDPEQRRLGFLDPSSLDPNNTSSMRNFTASLEVASQSIPLYVKRTVAQSQSGDVHYRVPIVANVSLPTTATQGRELRPVLDYHSSHSFQDEVNLGCADASSCLSKANLILNAKAPTDVIVGEEKPFEVEAELQIKDDVAFGVQLRLTTPEGLAYSRVTGDDYVPSCTTESGTDHVLCNLRREFSAGEKVKLTFHLSQSILKLLRQEEEHLHLELQVTSDGNDPDLMNNNVTLQVLKVQRTGLTMTGVSEPESVEVRLNQTWASFNDLNRDIKINASQLGPLISHTFIITNAGPTPLTTSQIKLELPSTTLAQEGLPLFYVVNAPLTQGPLSCVAPMLNSLNLTVNNDRKQNRVGAVLPSSVNRTKRQAHQPAETLPQPAPRQEGKRNDVVFNCSERDCEKIMCHMQPLMAKEVLQVKVSGYMVVATIKRLLNSKRGSMTVSSSVRLHTDQHCVTLNSQPVFPLSVAAPTYCARDSSVPSLPTRRRKRHANANTTDSDQLVPTAGGVSDDANEVEDEDSEEVEDAVTHNQRIYAVTHINIDGDTHKKASLMDVTPWYFIIILGIAVVIVLLVAGVLHKVGFFKRKRLNTEQRELLRQSQRRRTQRQSRRVPDSDF